VRIPDYVSPIIGYRVWRWEAAGLRSLNFVPWIPGKAMGARCRVVYGVKVNGQLEAADGMHDAPQMNCTCGVYAAKTVEHLRQSGYERCGVFGEVYLWGSVVEHQLGWRAEFAYPKSLCLPLDTLPFTLKAVQSRIQSLISYRCDLFVVHKTDNIPLWRKGSGLASAGLDFLTSRGSNWYARHQQERSIKAGDRVAILGRGTAVVDGVGDKGVHAVLSNRNVLRIRRKEIVWDEQNMRWETSPEACVEQARKN
jgi:hypothetical protein